MHVRIYKFSGDAYSIRVSLGKKERHVCGDFVSIGAGEVHASFSPVNGFFWNEWDCGDPAVAKIDDRLEAQVADGICERVSRVACGV